MFVLHFLDSLAKKKNTCKEIHPQPTKDEGDPDSAASRRAFRLRLPNLIQPSPQPITDPTQREAFGVSTHHQWVPDTSDYTLLQ